MRHLQRLPQTMSPVLAVISAYHNQMLFSEIYQSVDIPVSSVVIVSQSIAVAMIVDELQSCELFFSVVHFELRS